MIYRQLIKATSRYVSNIRFKAYLQRFYRENSKCHIQIQTVKAWIRLLGLLKAKKNDKIKQNGVFLQKINMENCFVKHQAFTLEGVDFQSLCSSNQMRKVYNVFMVCQMYYLWHEKRIFGKKIANGQQVFFKILIQNRQYQIDSQLKIQFW